MPRNSVSPRVRQLIASAEVALAELRRIRAKVDDYMQDGFDARAAVVYIALGLTHEKIDALSDALSSFGRAA